MARTRRPKVPQGPLRPFQVQLVGISVEEIRTSRRRRKATDSEKPRIESWLSPHPTASQDVGAFRVLAGAEVVHVTGRQAATVRCIVAGYFAYEGDVDARLLTRFQHREAMVLLWPYVRTAVAQVGQMMDLGLPPLPTLDVMGVLSASDEPEAVDDRG